MKHGRSIALASVVIVSGISNLASADNVTYWGYPAGGAPGGSTYTYVSGTGSINAGGSTHEYAGFNPAAYTNLYWVIDTTAGLPYLGQSASDTLSFDSGRSNLAGGILAFDGSYSLSTAFGPESYFGELLVTVTNPALGPLSLDSPSMHNGMATADGGALKVTGPYDVNVQFLMGTSATSLQDAADFYNNAHANGSLLSSESGGFYYTPVPLPAAALLMLSGLGGLGSFARRRQSA